MSTGKLMLLVYDQVNRVIWLWSV